MKRSYAFRCLTIAALSLPLTVGCGGGSTSTTADNTPAAGGAKTSGSESTATATAGTTTSQPKVVDGAGTEPAQAVAIFLDSLRRGDETAANAVLTTKSREEIAKTNRVLQPLGTPEGQFKIGRLSFPYSDVSDVALVECVWTEPAQAGEPEISIDIVCEVHKESEGWRISGMVVSMTGTDESVVLDFEDANSLEATIEAATSAPPAQSTANSNAASQTNYGNLPELPSFPQGASGSAGVDQIALPPQNDSPIRR
jgi:hypothetical protein